MASGVAAAESTDEVIQRTAEFVQASLSGDGSGHDWWHVDRVWRMAKRLAREEHADLTVVELAALLHDIADWKFHDGDEEEGPTRAQTWLRGLGVEGAVIESVCSVIREVSFRGAGVPDRVSSIEAKVVQDADRLDAIGAIGIARAFAYGGFSRHAMHDPGIQPQVHATFDEYKSSRGTTVNHFHEKLLMLKDRMHTASARRIAERRHARLEQFLRDFTAEWDGRE